mmetsp:Transcript_46303/g.124409  ORF Transcript_46303/g.124409 Transcript_46303/m.124409 type:complete len:283 (+) Transcript_46303:189-1037(+)
MSRVLPALVLLPRFVVVDVLVLGPGWQDHVARDLADGALVLEPPDVHAPQDLCLLLVLCVNLAHEALQVREVAPLLGGRLRLLHLARQRLQLQVQSLQCLFVRRAHARQDLVVLLLHVLLDSPDAVVALLHEVVQEEHEVMLVAVLVLLALRQCVVLCLEPLVPAPLLPLEAAQLRPVREGRPVAVLKPRRRLRVLELQERREAGEEELVDVCVPKVPALVVGAVLVAGLAHELVEQAALLLHSRQGNRGSANRCPAMRMRLRGPARTCPSCGRAPFPLREA